MPYAPLRRTIMPLGRAYAGATQWWLSGGISASNCIAAYAAKGAASQAASYSNLANPGTHDAFTGHAPSWSSGTGWTFNGQYDGHFLKTDIVPGSAWTTIVRYSNYTGGDAWLPLFGVGDTTGNLTIYPNRFNTVIYISGNASAFVAPFLNAGVLAIANRKCYRNGSLDQTISAAAAEPNLTIYLGSYHSATAGATDHASGFCPCQIQAWAAYNTELSAAQVAAVTSAINLL